MSTVGGEVQAALEKHDAARKATFLGREEVRHGKADLLRAAVGIAKALREPSRFLRPVPRFAGSAMRHCVDVARYSL